MLASTLHCSADGGLEAQEGVADWMRSSTPIESPVLSSIGLCRDDKISGRTPLPLPPELAGRMSNRQARGIFAGVLL